MEGIGNVERLKVTIPAVEDTTYQHRKLLGTQQGKRRMLRALQSNRAVRARIEQRHQKRVLQRGRRGIQERHAQNLGLNALASSVVAAQVVGCVRDNALARSPRGIGGALSTRGPRYIQQLDPATRARTKDRAQQLDIAHGIGMRGKVIRQVDHAFELVGLIQVLQKLFPRGMGR